jgi:hypothetical protein
MALTIGGGKDLEALCWTFFSFYYYYLEIQAPHFFLLFILSKASQFQALHSPFFSLHVIDFLVVVSRKLGVLNSPLLLLGFFGYELFVFCFLIFFIGAKI